MKAKRRNKIAAVVFLFLLLAALLGNFIGCISQYFHYAVSREDLQCERLTFEKCVEKNFQRGIYKLYFEACEIKTGNRAILSLEDYTAVNQGNQTIGLAVCPIAFLAIACVLIFVVRSL